MLMGDFRMICHVWGLEPAPTDTRYSLKSLRLKALPLMSTSPPTLSLSYGIVILASGTLTSILTVAAVEAALSFPAVSTVFTV